jgi:2-deoxy-D-gluconate 3-dehydrogenase
MGRVQNKVALITGGASGIGFATAQLLRQEGARVVIGDLAGPASERAVSELAHDGSGGEVAFHPLDVTREADWVEVTDRILRDLGRLDILVNNAGTNIRKPPDVVSVEEWKTVLDTNLTSAFVCSHAAYPHMKKAGGGKIINIGSMMSIFGAGFAPAYAASKGGIVQFGRACASAWAKDNIQVNAVLPGWIDTDLTKGARREVAGLHERVLARTPAARWGIPKDFAGIAVFLASAASDFVTGTAIPVDGGFSVQG